MTRGTHEERSEATKSALVRAADSLFAARGYASTSIDDILRASKLTRGALYHHFESKAEIFVLVFEGREAQLTERMRNASSRSRGAWPRFQTGCSAFLEACLERGVQQIVLIDAWSVLGFEAIRDIEARYTFALLREGLRAAVREKAVDVSNVDVMANFLLGALSQCAMTIARARDPLLELKAAQRELDRMLSWVARSSR